MKILGISGSSRHKNTNFMLKTFLDATGSDYELVLLKDNNIRPCLNCKSCHDTFKCAQNDNMQSLHQKLIDADVVVLGSPTYFDNVTGIMKNFMDRCLPFYFSRKLEGKRAVVMTSGGFSSLVDLDQDGACMWCKDDDACIRTVSRCLDSLKYFSNQLGMNIVGEVYAIHGDSAVKRNELIDAGKQLMS